MITFTNIIGWTGVVLFSLAPLYLVYRITKFEGFWEDVLGIKPRKKSEKNNEHA